MLKKLCEEFNINIDDKRIQNAMCNFGQSYKEFVKNKKYDTFHAMANAWPFTVKEFTENVFFRKNIFKQSISRGENKEFVQNRLNQDETIGKRVDFPRGWPNYIIARIVKLNADLIKIKHQIPKNKTKQILEQKENYFPEYISLNEYVDAIKNSESLHDQKKILIDLAKNQPDILKRIIKYYPKIAKTLNSGLGFLDFIIKIRSSSDMDDSFEKYVFDTLGIDTDKNKMLRIESRIKEVKMTANSENDKNSNLRSQLEKYNQGESIDTVNSINVDTLKKQVEKAEKRKTIALKLKQDIEDVENWAESLHFEVDFSDIHINDIMDLASENLNIAKSALESITQPRGSNPEPPPPPHYDGPNCYNCGENVGRQMYGYKGHRYCMKCTEELELVKLRHKNKSKSKRLS